MESVPALPTATYLRAADGFWLGDARVYQLSPPLIHGSRKRLAHKVIVHAIPSQEDGQPGKTVVFPATSSGMLDTIAPIGGSPRRGLSHMRTLRAAGYEIARPGRAS